MIIFWTFLSCLPFSFACSLHLGPEREYSIAAANFCHPVKSTELIWTQSAQLGLLELTKWAGNGWSQGFSIQKGRALHSRLQKMHPFSFQIKSHLSSLGASLSDKWCYQGSLLMPFLNQSGSKLSQDVNLSLSAPQRRSTEGLIALSCFQTTPFYRRRHKTFHMHPGPTQAGCKWQAVEHTLIFTHWYSQTYGQSILMDLMKLTCRM